MKGSVLQKIIASALLLAALVMLGVGAARTHKVYDEKDAFADFGLVTFTRISDRQLVEDATFTGVMQKGGKLYSTYDRSAPRGKRMCPT